MLDWLKDALGEHYSDELDRRVSEEIGKGFVARADYDALGGQLKEASGQIEGFKALDVEGVRRAAGEWEGKYKALQGDMERRERLRAAERASGGLRFSSESAKRAFLGELEARGLPAQDGRLLGFDDFVKDYRGRDAAAFLPDTPLPRVAASTPGAPAPANDARTQANTALRSLFGKE